MGCWNETCGFSNLAIESGNKVACFIIDETHIIEAPDRDADGNVYGKKIDIYGEKNDCYASSFGLPVFLPLIGSYDDYGSIENIEENIASKALLKIFNEKLSSGMLDLSFDDDGKIDKFEDIDHLCRVIERGDLIGFSSNYGFNSSHLYRLYMVHYDIYKEVSKMNQKYKDLSIISWKADLQHDHRILIENYKMFRLLKDCKKEDKIKNLYFELNIPERTEEEKKKLKKQREKWDENFVDLEGLFGGYDYKEFVKELNCYKMEDYIDDICDYGQFYHMVIKTRRNFGATTGKGSQSDGIKEQMKVNKAIQKQLKKQYDRLKEYV